MSKKYVIRWKSKVNGRAGRGTKEFGREEGEKLIAELNEEYPDIEHELILAPPPQLDNQTQAQQPSEDANAGQKDPMHAASYEYE